MRTIAACLFALVLTTIGLVNPALADQDDPLFINLTTDEPHRAMMAIDFGRKQFDRGHPLTFFLNDKGVFIGAKARAETFADHQAALAGLMEKGAVVIVCPVCMKHYQIDAADLIDGAKVGNPELTGNALFADDSQALTW